MSNYAVDIKPIKSINKRTGLKVQCAFILYGSYIFLDFDIGPTYWEGRTSYHNKLLFINIFNKGFRSVVRCLHPHVLWPCI